MGTKYKVTSDMGNGYLTHAVKENDKTIPVPLRDENPLVYGIMIRHEEVFRIGLFGLKRLETVALIE